MGGLFDLTRLVSKQSDASLAKKATKKPTTRKVSSQGSNVLEEAISRVRATLFKYEGKYKLFTEANKGEFESFVGLCVKNGIVAIDTETDQNVTIGHYDVGIAGFSLTTFDQENPKETMVSCYVPLNHKSYWTKQRVPGQFAMEYVANQVRRLLVCKTIWQNAKFDIQEFAIRFGVRFEGPWWDTLVAAQQLDENEPHTLKYLYSKYVTDNEDQVFSFSSLFDGVHFCDLPMDVGALYAAHDPEMTALVYLYQKERLHDHPERYGLQGVASLFRNVEMPLIDCVVDMELRGIMIDPEYSKRLSVEYGERLKKAEAEYELEMSKYANLIQAYQKRNPGKLPDVPQYSSPQQMAIFIYDVLGKAPVDKKKPRGTGKEILKALKEPVFKKILACREIEKLLGTYIDKLPLCVSKVTGAIHASFNQCGTEEDGVVTGRFSSSDPNLQNIPSHDDNIRRMFVARPGYVLVGSDYSQQEPHILAQVAQDKSLKDAYDNDVDVYAHMANLVTGRPYNDCREFYVNPDGSWKLDEHGARIENKEGHAIRSQFKVILLALMYGKQVNSLSEDLGVSKQQAQKVIDDFYKAFPRVRQYIEGNMEFARKNGYVESLWGRRRRLPDMQLPKYDISAKEGYVRDFNPFAFGTQAKQYQLSEADKKAWWTRMNKAFGRDKQNVIAEADAQGVTIVDNSMRLADAERQCCNSVIQGSAADMSKVAMVKMRNDPLLTQLDYHILIAVHDEIIGECPEGNIAQVAKRVQELMVEACHEKVHMKMKTDVEVSKAWKGEPYEYQK